MSRIFTVRKKDSSCRPVVNLKLHPEDTLQDGELSNALDYLQSEDWMTTIDFKNAFLSVLPTVSTPVAGDTVRVPESSIWAPRIFCAW